MRLDITGRHVDITAAAPAAHRPPAGQARAPPQRQRHLRAGHPDQGEVPPPHRDHHPCARRSHAARPRRGHRAGRSSVRQAAAKIEQQAQKLKGKWDERKRRGAGARAIAARRAPETRAAARGSCARRATPSSRCRSRTRRCASKPAPRRSSSSATPTPTPSASSTGARTATSADRAGLTVTAAAGHRSSERLR